MAIVNPKPTTAVPLNDKKLNGTQWDAEAERVILVDSTGTIIDGSNPIPTSDATYTKKMENLSSGQPLYIGEAQPGTATTASTWRIRKMEYDNGNNYPPTAEVWADGTSDFDKVWNDRATYTYS